MKKLYILLFPLAMVISSTQAQDEGFIYGKVTTHEGKIYEGPLRWGKEEVYWVDVFNASKQENKNLKYLTRHDLGVLDEQRTWRNGNIISSSALRWLGIDYRNESRPNNDFVHQFSCQFGDIRSITPRGSRRVEVALRSGLVAELDGEGYNDVGTTVRILDKELGQLSMDWSRIRMIEFMNTPSKLSQKFGEPLFGSVTSYNGTFTGYIQWDHDERVSTDKLDGDSQDGDVAILFEKIKSIERRAGRSLVTLQSGRGIELHGSNDVNHQNRGIIITDDTGMMIDIPWEEFKKLTLMPPPSKPIARYADFTSQKEITATVSTLGGATMKGKTVIDLDEEFDFELFQGKEGDVEYSIPVRNIKKINVIHGYKAEVYLRNGRKLNLDESQDVGELNQGVLVFTGKGDPSYTPWKEVSEITFD